TAFSGGGILNAGPDHTLTVTNSTFSGNEACGGAGIFNGAGFVTVINSTFSGNIACVVGGGIASSGTLTVTNSTFSDNRGGIARGGAIVTYGVSATVKGTIIVAAKGDTGFNCHGVGSREVIDAGYNISDDHSCGFTPTGSASNGGGV